MIQKSHSFKTKKNIKVQFLAEIEFGVPSKKCKNFGICRISPLGKFEYLGQSLPKNSMPKEKCCAAVEGIVSVMMDNHVEMSFLKHHIEILKKEKYFYGNKFRVEEDFCLILQDSPRLEVKIKKGEYPVNSTDTLIAIAFDR